MNDVPPLIPEPTPRGAAIVAPESEPPHVVFEFWRRHGEPFFHRFGGLMALVVIAATAVVMLAWTWLRWADPIVNCGREFYIPWQLAQGKALYRDIPHFNGPFSQYFNALVFATLGRTVRSLVLANLVWLAALVAMVWWLWRTVADRFTATVACLVLLLLCSFIQLTRTGGFNFVTPFSHEMTHGVILSFAAISCLGAYLRSVYVRVPEGRWMVLAGLALGLVFLTRAEFFVAAAPPVLVGAGAGMYARRLPAPVVRRHLLVFVGAMLLPPLIALLFLGTAMPLREALNGVLGSWRWSFDEQVVGMTFYERLRGTDWPVRNLGKMLVCTLGYLVMLGSAALGGVFLRNLTEPRLLAPPAAALAVIGGFVIVYDTLEWQYVLMGLNLVMVALALSLGATLAQRPRDRIDAVLILRLTLVWFALLLLARMGLRVVLFEFGFVIAMPATLIAVAAAVGWLPALVRRRGGASWVPRMAALAALGVLAVQHLNVFGRNFNIKPIIVGTGADALRFDRARGSALATMLAEIDRRCGAAETLAVIPEGGFVNYFSHRVSPTGYVNLMPPELIMFGGQQRVLERFQQTPPDWVVVSYSSPEAYGLKSFAIDYGRDVWRWVSSNYHLVTSAQSGNVFFMRLYERNDRAPAAADARGSP